MLDKNLGKFTFHKSFYDAAEHLEGPVKWAFIRGIIEYGISGGKKLPNNLPNYAICAFEICRSIIDDELKENANKAKPRAKKDVVRHKYGEYDNVLLTDEQLEKLKKEFPRDFQERIERLSEYMVTSGKSYKNHYATIKAWARKETKNKKKPEWVNKFGDDLPDF